ncbi:MAG: hypothetical protein HY861_00120 [Chlamydiia bacterium]|nr:hypothetical protein [Chlamydiia bacterium]
MKKQPFVLFEILIALTLVILCAVPLALKPIQLYRSEMRFFEELEGERLADLTFSEIKESLLRNEIPWKDLPTMNETTESFPLPSSAIYIPGKEPKSIERSFTLFCKGEKRGIENQVYRLLHVKIALRPQLLRKKEKTYRLAVQLRARKEISSQS